MIASKILNRLDLSNDFWAQFDVQTKTLSKLVSLHKIESKLVSLYKIESIDNRNILNISINPKVYFKKYRDKIINKKHKGLKRDTPGMDFEACLGLLCYMSFVTKKKQTK